MNSLRTFQAVSLLFAASAVGCGGSSPTNTVSTKEDASKIRSAMAGPMSAVSTGEEAACPEGGTVKIDTSIGADVLKGEVSTTTTYTFTGCISQGVTLSGSWSQVSKTTAGGQSLTYSGHLETSLGSCILDLHGTIASSARTGTFCGFEYNSLPN